MLTSLEGVDLRDIASKTLDPNGKRIQNFRPDADSRASTSRKHMKRMIGTRKPLKPSARAKLLGEFLHEFAVCESIPSPLQKQHWNFHLE
jgi:hypothetical protein